MGSVNVGSLAEMENVMSIRTFAARTVVLAVMVLGGLLVGRGYAACGANKLCTEWYCFYEHKADGWHCWYMDDERDVGFMVYPFAGELSDGTFGCPGGDNISVQEKTSCSPCDATSAASAQEADDCDIYGNIGQPFEIAYCTCT